MIYLLILLACCLSFAAGWAFGVCLCARSVRIFNEYRMKNDDGKPKIVWLPDDDGGEI